MANVLYIDSEPEAVEAIRAEGHNVHAGCLGYRTGKRNLGVPPHEFDLIVCDLQKPACFDMTQWGSGKNNNYECTLVKNLTQTASLRKGELMFHQQIIHESHLGPVMPGRFGPADVFAAINVGVPAILFDSSEKFVGRLRFRQLAK